ARGRHARRRGPRRVRPRAVAAGLGAAAGPADAALAARRLVLDGVGPARPPGYGGGHADLPSVGHRQARQPGGDPGAGVSAGERFLVTGAYGCIGAWTV